MATNLSYVPDGQGGLTFKLTPLDHYALVTEIHLSRSETCTTAALILGTAGITRAVFEGGNCDLHNAEMLVDNWSDGSHREDYGSADRALREEAALAAHQKVCNDQDCECRMPAGGGR
jgi:hypothetical protein